MPVGAAGLTLVLLVFSVNADRSCDKEECSSTWSKQLCPDSAEKPTLEKEPQSWQEVTGRELIVFSAYVDKRLLAGGPAIRIVASGLQEQFNVIGDLFCQFWFESSDRAVSLGPAEYIRIYPSTMHPDMWVSHFVLCPLPTYQHDPYAVSVTSEQCSRASNHLKVISADGDTSATFGVCISPVYNGFDDWQMVVEWLEMNKVIGADEIAIYSLSPGANVKKVLEYYAQNSHLKVHVINWNFPPRLKSNVWCQRAALNDCLYRMGRHHRYVAVTDLDELLVPRNARSWAKLIPSLGKKNTGAFLFQHAYFRRNKTSAEEPFLITQQSLWRTENVTPPGKIRCKTMYEATKAVKVDLHFPFELISGAEEYILDPVEGMLHHYRKDPMESFRKNPAQFTFIEDTYMLEFGDKVEERVRTVAKAIGL